MLDVTLITSRHVIMGLLSFGSVFLLIQQLLQHPAALRHPRDSRARLAGAALIIAVTLLSLAVIENHTLKIGLLLAAALTALFGTADEIFNLSPLIQVAMQATIAAVAVAAGWSISYVSNPVGEGIVYITLAPGVLTVIWLLFLMNSINWLDGADGLASGVGTVALLTLAAVSLLPATQDTRTLSLALIGAGATAAYLIWNWPPARVYLGTSGSWFLGLSLGLTAIIGGGKLATTLLVLALPALDAVLVALSRLRAGRPPWRRDRRHLHFRLQALGLSPAAIAMIMIAGTAVLGAAAVMLQTQLKLLALGAVAAVLLLTSTSLWRHQQETSS